MQNKFLIGIIFLLSSYALAYSPQHKFLSYVYTQTTEGLISFYSSNSISLDDVFHQIDFNALDLSSCLAVHEDIEMTQSLTLSDKQALLNFYNQVIFELETLELIKEGFGPE